MSPSSSETARCRTRGARLLDRYIEKHYESLAAFARHADVDRVTLVRALTGERWKRVTADFAFAVQKATNGEVPAEAWCSATARLVEN